MYTEHNTPVTSLRHTMNVKELLDRYSLSSRKSLYSRLEAAEVKLPKDDDGKAYATEQIIQQLDDLDKHIKNGGTLKNYTPVIHTTTHLEASNNGDFLDSVVDTTQLTTQVTTLRSREELLEIIEVLGTAIATRFKPVDPIAYNASLEKAQANNWILSTSEVQQLIGIKPSCKKGKKTFTRGCWTFIKTGKMEGFVSSNNGSLAVRETGEIDQAAQQVNLENSPQTQEPNQDQFAALVRSSAEYAAGMEIAKYTIAKQMQENPDLLPTDLKEQVEAAKASCSPKSLCPTAIANQFLAAYKA